MSVTGAQSMNKPAAGLSADSEEGSVRAAHAAIGGVHHWSEARQLNNPGRSAFRSLVLFPQPAKVGAVLVSLVILTTTILAAPQEDLKKAVTQVLKTLDSKKSVKEKRALISGIYDENFNIEKMASNTLKSDYKKLEDGEKKQFAQKFGRFVLEFYLDKIDKYDRNKVEFIGEETKGNRAVVKTLLEYQRKMANVNYFMTEKDGRWLVYDFEVEGVRLSSTYRSQFAKVLKEQGYAGLSIELDKLLANYRK